MKRLTADQVRMIIEHRQLAGRTAERYMKYCPQRWRDDLRSAALEGLIGAARNFDPSRGVKFSTFAEYRIDGAIRDEIRHLYAGRRRPDGTRSRPVVTSFEDLRHQLIVRNGADDWEPRCLADFTADPAFDDGSLGAAGLSPADAINQAVPVRDDADGRTRHVAFRYYIDGLTMQQIADELGVTESRVCQILAVIRPRLATWASRQGLRAA